MMMSGFAENDEWHGTLKELEKVHQEILKCQRCPLYKYITNKVPGEGDPTSGIMFIGEAPGREEDKQGRPFVGPAGKLLTKMIEEKLGIQRSKVYITNVLKCRPPNNRDPKPEEIEACSIWLKKQLEIIKPRVVVTLGRYSTEWIFKYFGLKFTKISEVRGKVYTVKKWDHVTYIIPTYHPAAVLYHPQWKEAFERDFELIKKVIEGKEKKPKTLVDFF